MNPDSFDQENFEKLENIAIIGNGGRENSLGWIIQKNKKVKNIYMIPGNGGSEYINKCQNINLNYLDSESLISKLIKLDIDLIVIGPETPLANGLGDILRARNFCVFGPGSDGAKLESSKSWAKNFMHEANIPTADFWKVTSFSEAEKIISNTSNSLVVKADGLASGKGVFIPETKEETLQITKEILDGKFGESGKTIVLEEKLEGPEVSVFALCDGEKYVILPTAQDHKRLEEGDKGLNTGGMGAYSPTPLISKIELIKIEKEIVIPTINQLIKKNIDYRGVIYFGLMITENGAKVIEYNCRFGDPECQTIMPLMNQDFIHLLQKCAMGKLKGDEKIEQLKKVSGCVVATSKGYPLNYDVGFPIQINSNEEKDLQVFHSGTSINKFGEIITNGGRVLSIVCQGKDFNSVFEKAYKYLNNIKFEGIFYRTDIGHQVRNDLKGAKN